LAGTPGGGAAAVVLEDLIHDRENPAAEHAEHKQAVLALLAAAVCVDGEPAAATLRAAPKEASQSAGRPAPDAAALDPGRVPPQILGAIDTEGAAAPRPRWPDLSDLARNPPAVPAPGQPSGIPELAVPANTLPTSLLRREEPPPPPEPPAPLAGALPLDLKALERSADAFFARLAHLGEECCRPQRLVKVASWAAVVTAVAYEFARLHRGQPGRRPAPSGSVPGLTLSWPGDDG
jgi:hypothetical protein